MANLKAAHKQLFARSPDERCEDLPDLSRRCQRKREQSQDRWESPQNLATIAESAEGRSSQLRAKIGSDGYWLNDWSFSQLCKMAGVAKDTVNRLSPETAAAVYRETLPRSGQKPLQFFVEGETVRSIHGTQYTRLWDIELVRVLQEFATDFQPPQKGFNGATGLYVGEQDLFAFLVDPLGWIEIGDQAFAPGFFCWNSEVGRRSLGISTFWFQAVCANHIVWDAVDVVDFSRKHTANVHEGLNEIRRIIEKLVQRRDERKDGFASVIEQAMSTQIGDNVDDATKFLLKNGVTRSLATRALEIAQDKGAFTIFSVVDALTMLARDVENAGDRTDADQKAASLLSLVNS
ncbi:MAG: hypothetical protein KDA80_13985 [Planctomycetaceae bacterium]|nr:hypothetical protein [Planctomycetaceae bacterium]